MNLFDHYRGRRALVTGHTGFKGSWLSLWLSELGAEVTGFSDIVPDDPAMFDLVGIGNLVDDRRGDIRDLAALKSLVAETRPQIIFHLAAQPIVRIALEDPYDTFAVNVLGTAAVLEAARLTPGVEAVVIVTSDKVYRDEKIPRAYDEAATLGGHEPYGASKAAAEIVADVYKHARFHAAAGSRSVPAVATARAGNVIGGGDWARDRLIPDIVRAIGGGRDLVLRYPDAVRPWQHVLEPLSGYLHLGLSLLETPDVAPRALNFGPRNHAPVTVRELAERFFASWGETASTIRIERDTSAVETALLSVDSGLAEQALGWRAAWDARRAVEESAHWYAAWSRDPTQVAELSRRSIAEYTRDAELGGIAWASAQPVPAPIAAVG